MGRVELALGNLGAALQEYRDGHDLASRLAIENPGDVRTRRDLSVGCTGMGDVLLGLGRFDQSRVYYATALDLTNQLATADPTDAQAQHDLSTNYEKLGDVMWRLKWVDDARDAYTRGLDIRRRLVDASPEDSQLRRGLIVGLCSLGIFYQDGLRDFPAALEAFNSATAAARSCPHPERFVDEVAFLELRIDECWGYLPSAQRPGTAPRVLGLEEWEPDADVRRF